MSDTHKSAVGALLFAGALVFAGGWSLRAAGRQNQPSGGAPPAASTATPAKERTKPELTIHNMKRDDRTKVTSGTDFRYVEDDTVITGDKATYYGAKELLVADTNLVLDDPKHHITGDHADVYNGKDKKLAIVTGKVVIFIKPKEAVTPVVPGNPSPGDKGGKLGLAQVTPPITPSAPTAAAPKNEVDAGKERSRGVTITCDRVESYYRKKFTILKGHLTFLQKFVQDGKTIERTMTAEHAEYDGKKDNLVLFAPVEGKDSEGQEMRFTTDVSIGTKEGEETLESAGKATFKINVESDDGDETQTPAKPVKPAKKQ